LSGGNLLVLLCTYNEIENLPRVVAETWQAVPQAHILVIDDHSPDGTGNWVRAHAAIDRQLFLIRRAGKQGLGTALKAGIGWCLDHGYDYLLNLDADLSHPPAIIPKLLERCQQPDCDVAIGSRYIAGGGFSGLPLHRRWMSRGLNAYARRRLKLPLTDCSGSLRCYSRGALEQLPLAQLQCGGYGFLEEVLVHLHAAGARFCEVPFIFSARAGGHSKLSMADAIGALSVIHRLGKP
jgi:dolichol-phosphate mannosyltransferase